MTRPTRFLTEHFFRALFDFGILTPAGADSFMHMLLGAVGAVIAFGFALTRIYAGKYAALSASASPEPYRHAVLGDDLFMVGFAMLLVAFVTLLVSYSLFPDERDFRILGPLPVPKAVVFGAKLSALFLFTGVFIALAHVSLIPLMLLTSMNRFAEHAVLSRLTAWAVASISASVFAVLAVTAIGGVLMLALAGNRLQTLTATMRSVMLAMLVLSVPLVFHLPSAGASFASGSRWLMLLPPAWFVGLERVLLGSAGPWFMDLTAIALAALSGAATIVAVTYVRLFTHFERVILRSRAVLAPRSRRVHTPAFSRAAPAFRAVYGFTAATLGRSQLHQGVLVGLAACGVGIAVNSLIGADRSSSLVNRALWTPFALMFACGISARAALALPMEYRANWIFRLTEDQATRGEQLRAVDQMVTVFVVGVPFAAAVPTLGVALGPTAVIAVAIVALVGLVFVHAVLLDWRRIPFTCSYLPGKRFVAHSVVVGFAAFQLFTLGGVWLVHAATASMMRALVIAAVLFRLAYVLKRRRLAIWSATPLMFEDEFPDEPLQLRL
jgi:hypothetical protein